MFFVRKKLKALLLLVVSAIFVMTFIPKPWTYKGKTMLQIKQRHIYEKEHRFKRAWRQAIKITSTILTDKFLNIEREGKFPGDDPCPYLGVRKPMRDSRYPSDYQGITCKPHRAHERDCDLAYELYGSSGELPTQECDEIDHQHLCKFTANHKSGIHNLECDWSVCFPRQPYMGEMNAKYGQVIKWLYAPSDESIEEVIYRSLQNGFHFVFFKCGSLMQVVSLPQTIKLSPKSKKDKKINVNIILIDSISRPHFYRSMPQTVEALRHVVYNKSVQATVLDFEMLQSVSQHTMDNCRPLYSGVTSGVYQEFSSKWRKSMKSLGIAVLFGEYKRSGYQTLFQEEGCWYDRWGLMLTDVERHATPKDKTGFAKRWTELQKRWKDYYIDDFGLTHFTCEVVKKYGQTNDLDIPEKVCLNGEFISTYYLNYHLKYLRSVRDHPDSLPLLHYLHLVTGHTSSGTRIRNDDVGLANYIRRLSRSPNTLTIFLSDHGHTRTSFARTVEGRFELSNPLMFVMLSEDVAKKLGKDRVSSLVENQRRLFTTLDVHKMLMALNDPVKIRSEDYKVNGILSVLPSNRTCENLPLTPLTRCKCEGWDQKVEDNSQRHIWLAEFALGQLNNMIQEQFRKGKMSGSYGSCLRLRGLETKNNFEKQTKYRLQTTMDLAVESALPNMVEIFQVMIETPLLPDEAIGFAELVKFDRHTLYNRFEHCVDDTVDIKLCTCAAKSHENATMSSTALRSLASQKVFGIKANVTSLDKTEGCLHLLSRKQNFSIAYEIVNLCDKTYEFVFHGEVHNMLLTAKLPLRTIVEPMTIYFLLSAARYVVNDSYFDIRTDYKVIHR